MVWAQCLNFLEWEVVFLGWAGSLGDLLEWEVQVFLGFLRFPLGCRV
jgi:hypothetical protein